MKKLLSLSAGILFAGFIVAQAVPNGGFENWTNVTFNDLGGYLNSNDQDIQKGLGLAGVNAVRSTSAFHGNYALQLTTIKIGLDTLPAYVSNGGNPLQGQGGLPTGWTGAQIPTGIRFRYTCNIVAGDTVGAMAVFKKSGVVIGGYLFPITVSQGSYTLYTKILSPALVAAPDTVIFAAISSVAAIYDSHNNKGCYPGNTITLDSVNFTGPVTQPALFNGDFENWKSDTLYQPTGWNCLFPGSFESQDVHAGVHAAQISTMPPAPGGGGGPVPGFLSTGSIQNIGQGGYPYTNTTDTFEFYYKYAPAIAADSGLVLLTFKKAGSQVGFAGMELKPAASYTLNKVGFTIGAAPDSVIVTFSSSKTNNPPPTYIGSTLKVDNAFFKSQQSADLGITEISVVEGIKIYPNPVTSSFNLNTEGYTGSVQSMDVYDMMGRAVISASYASGLNTDITSFDMSKTAPGIYIVKVLTSTGVFYQKISKVQ